MSEFRAGDVVYVEAIDEEWVLAADEHDGRVVCAGWPESLVEASKCQLLKSATDEQRADMLAKVSQFGDGSMRSRWAASDLAKAVAP